MTASGQLRLPSCWAAEPLKSSVSSSPLDARRQPQLEVGVGGLEHVGRAPVPVRQLGEPRPRAALRVVERLLEPGAERLQAEPLDQRLDALGAGAAGRELGAQVGLALARVAHAPGQLAQRLGVEPRGRDHDALVGKGARVGGHAAGLGGADVGVVGAAGGEPDQLACVEERVDHGDVGQVGAARVRVVEDPGDAGLVALIEHRRHGRGHGAEVDRDVLGLHHHAAALVE